MRQANLYFNRGDQERPDGLELPQRNLRQPDARPSHIALLAGLSILFGAVFLALALAMARLSGVAALDWFARFYVFVFRDTRTARGRYS